MAIHLEKRVAGRTFKAKCGHVIKKGKVYVCFTDYVMWNRYYASSCPSCWNKQSNIQLVNGEFLLAEEQDDKRLMEEFHTLCNIHPQNEAQAEWILKAIRQFKKNHPQLVAQIERHGLETLKQDLNRIREKLDLNPFWRKIIEEA